MKADITLLKTRAFSVDSAKFIAYPLIFISDVTNNEGPKLTIRLLHYPRLNKTQLCLAAGGKFHPERLSYWENSPFDWRERMWIYMDVETARKIAKCIEEMVGSS